jgi:type I restriction enzyme, S subunit
MIGELKPYSAYKDSGVSWLDVVPEHWNVLPLSSVYQQKQVKNKGLLEDTVLSLSYGRIIVRPKEKLHGLVPESFETYQVVDPNDIIIRPTDLQNDKVSLRVGQVEQRGIITSAYMCLRTYGSLSAKYGYALLNTYDLLKVFYGYGSGLRQNLDFTCIKRMPVLVPPVEEQAAIAHFLAYADRRIRRYIHTKQKLIKLLEEQKQVVINEVATHGLDHNVLLRPSGIEWLGDIPEHWSVKRIRHLVDVYGPGIQMGPFGSSLTTLAEQPTGYKLYGQENTISGDFEKGQRWLLATQYQLLKKYEIRPKDIVLTRKGSIGQCRLVPEGIQTGIADSDTIRVRLDSSQLEADFFVLLLHDASYIQRQVTATRRGAVLSGLNTMTVANLCLAVPPRDEQVLLMKEIYAQVAEFASAIENTKTAISLLHEFRTRLIADVVTGKLDVREAAAKLPVEVEASDLEDAELGSDPDLNDSLEDEAA